MQNRHGEWSVRVEPGGLQIDTFHADKRPHLHTPADYDRRIPIPLLTAQHAAMTVYDHLERERGVRLPLLLQELNPR